MLLKPSTSAKVKVEQCPRKLPLKSIPLTKTESFDERLKKLEKKMDVVCSFLVQTLGMNEKLLAEPNVEPFVKKKPNVEPIVKEKPNEDSAVNEVITSACV